MSNPVVERIAPLSDMIPIVLYLLVCLIIFGGSVIACDWLAKRFSGGIADIFKMLGFATRVGFGLFLGVGLFIVGILLIIEML